MYKLSKRTLNKNLKKKSNKLMRGGSECENYNAKYVKYNKIYNEENKKIRDLKSNIEEIESIINENTNDKLLENEEYTTITNQADKIKKRLQLYEQSILDVIDIIKKSMAYFKQQEGGHLFTKHLMKELHILEGGVPTNDGSEQLESNDNNFEEQIEKIGKPFDDKLYTTIDKFINSKYQITCFDPYDKLIQMIDTTINNSITTLLKIFDSIKNSLPIFQKNIINSLHSRLNIIKAQLETCETECGENELTPEQKKIKCESIKCIPDYLFEKGKLKNCSVFQEGEEEKEKKCNEIYDVCNYTARDKPTKTNCADYEKVKIFKCLRHDPEGTLIKWDDGFLVSGKGNGGEIGDFTNGSKQETYMERLNGELKDKHAKQNVRNYNLKEWVNKDYQGENYVLVFEGIGEFPTHTFAFADQTTLNSAFSWFKELKLYAKSLQEGGRNKYRKSKYQNNNKKKSRRYNRNL